MAKRKHEKKQNKADASRGEGGDKKARIPTESREPPCNADKAIPVTILSGFLGSGKTTLIKHILTSKTHGLRIAVIVNDMSELNVDGQTIKASVKKTKKEVVTLENGCICCTLRGDLIREINQIQKKKAFDYVLIESTGVAEPQQVAESFCVDPETNALAPNTEQMLWNVARLDTCVTVIDTVNFSDYVSSLHQFQEIFNDGLDGETEESEREGQKSISELMVEQVEFANVILLNKVDMVTQETIDLTKRLIQVLNPKARVIEGSFGNIDLLNILNTRLFNMQEASASPGWLSSLQHGVDTDHGEADEYGVTSFVYRARKPFHPQRIHSFLKQLFCFAEEWASSPEEARMAYGKNTEPTKEKYGTILRSKGTCWIAGRDHRKAAWAQSGRIVQLIFDAPWHCDIPESDQVDTESDFDYRNIPELFKGTFGDCRQEIVFIGTTLNRGSIEEELNKSLLTDEEMKHHSTTLPIGAYPDPLTPLAIEFDEARSLFIIARQGQSQHIRVLPGSSLCLSNLALNIMDEDVEDSIRSVRVWLDVSDDVERGILLATLRPCQHEQHSMSLNLLAPSEEESASSTIYRRIRVEIVPKKGVDKNPDEWLSACEVHITGAIEPVAYAPTTDENEDGSIASETEDNHCDRGDCPF